MMMVVVAVICEAVSQQAHSRRSQQRALRGYDGLRVAVFIVRGRAVGQRGGHDEHGQETQKCSFHT